MDIEKKEGVEEQLVVLRKVVLEKLKSLKKKRFEDKDIEDFGLAFRVFLLKCLKIDYEFTDEELVMELDKKGVNKALKERITKLTSLLSEVKYHGKKI
ncbi:MAG: hypothetical protein FD167_2829, partial [bacterium]